MALNKQHIRLIFGLKIKQLRQKRGMSFKDLAEKTGMSVSYLNEIEKGKKHPKSEKILLLSEALDVSYDQLVSLKLSKRMAPIAELLRSGFLENLPPDLFGLEPAKLLELISTAPDRINAFISTIIKIARSYELRQEGFYFAALRSFQEMNDNYFEEIELAVEQFLAETEMVPSPPVDRKVMTALLEEKYGYRFDRKLIGSDSELRQFRSVFSPSDKTLYINPNLTETQKSFLLGRELAFNHLGLDPRPLTTSLFEVKSFEEVLNNFKASYFSVALLMSQKQMLADLEVFFAKEHWDGRAFLKLMKKYKASPEMFLHRLTNLLPKHFGMDNLFFLRFEEQMDIPDEFNITKELHFSRLHNPHRNDLREHYCRRWISIQNLTRLRSHTGDFLLDAQRSSYISTDSEYFCISIGRPYSPTPHTNVTVTLGILIDARSRKRIRFIDSPKTPHMIVSETCERCPLTDCEQRAAQPTFVEQQDRQVRIRQRLFELTGQAEFQS